MGYFSSAYFGPSGTAPTPVAGAINLTGMRANMSTEIDAWGSTVKIARLSAARNSQGRMSGSYASVATEKMWIQAFSITDRDRANQGVVEGTTHYAYQKSSGYDVKETDRLTNAGDTSPYDIVGVERYATHQRLFLKRVTT